MAKFLVPENQPNAEFSAMGSVGYQTNRLGEYIEDIEKEILFLTKNGSFWPNELRFSHIERLLNMLWGMWLFGEPRHIAGAMGAYGVSKRSGMKK